MDLKTKINMKNEEQLFIGSTDNIKPRKRINWYKLLTFLAIGLITVTLIICWFIALSKF